MFAPEKVCCAVLHSLRKLVHLSNVFHVQTHISQRFYDGPPKLETGNSGPPKLGPYKETKDRLSPLMVIRSLVFGESIFQALPVSTSPGATSR